MDYGARLAWRGALAVEDVVAQRYYEDVTGEIDALITTQGAQVGDRLEAYLDIERLEGQWQGEPVQGQGQVRYDNGEILVDEFALTLAGNVVQANGKVVDQALDLALQVDAGHLGRLLPEAQGAIKGAVKLEGTLNNPAVAADLHWQDLAYQQTTAEADNKAMAFRSNKGQLRVNGRLNEGLDVALDADVAGSNIPEGEVALTAKVQRDKIQAIDLSLNTLGGSIHAQGNVALTPEVAWDIEAQVNQVDVGDYVQQVDGVVSAKVRSQGSLANNQVNMQTQLTELSGQWQGMPLSGQAEVKMQDGQLAIEGMNVAVGENHIDLKGDLNPKALDVSFDLQGENLSSFYPELGGRVSGQGRITGTAQSPNVAVTLAGNHIRYQNIVVASAKVSLNSAMRSGQPFENKVVLSGVQVGDSRWEQVALSTQGTFDKHTLSLKTTGGEVDVLLAANGGFQAIDSWAGRINALEIQGYEMDWRLTSPMNLVLSPQKIKADNLCLADAHSNLCVDIEKAERTRLAYRIERLDARSFAPFIPDNMRIEPALMGSGEVSMAQNGVLSGQAALEFTKGALYFQPEDVAPVRLMLREGAVNAHFTQRQAQVNAAIDFVHAGSIRAQMAVSNWSNPVVKGRLAVNVPDISHFEHFVPKVSELGGKIVGELRFAGALPNPEVSGEIVFSQGSVKIPEYATDLQDIVLRLRALETGRIDIDGKLGTPEGDLQANGQLALSPLALDLHLQGARMLAANSEEIRAVVSPNITVAVDPDSGVKVSGEVVVDEANVSIPSRSGGVAISEDVVIVGLEDHPKDRQAPALKENSPLEVRVDIRLGDKVFFQASEVKLRLIGGLKVMVLPSQPVIGRGVIEVASGVYELYGQELDIKRGKITFTGNNIANPAVDVLATREVDKVNVGAQINGTVENLSLSLIADPSMPDSAILSYLLFGRAPDGAMDSEALLQTAASLSLGQIFPSNLAEQTGLDVFDLGVTGLKAGKYLGEDLYVGMRSNFFTAVTEFVARYQFNKRLSVEATAKQNENAVDFLYEFEK
ncbi:translocation/assembly module TamB domain-containing protein [Rappaport israeli]|uniref:translocation/assembly module TamB domain-containing protein n=1 Tax=Rappaport israeli TaxID=1839807 RepID=UPI000B075B30|nr:translocation/assembly module TamB domain-containing protein [Rappaport israeli]